MQNKNYYFVYTLSGHTVTGHPINDTKTYRRMLTAKTREQAEYKLHGPYFKRVVINIKNVTCQ